MDFVSPILTMWSVPVLLSGVDQTASLLLHLQVAQELPQVDQEQSQVDQVQEAQAPLIYLLLWELHAQQQHISRETVVSLALTDLPAVSNAPLMVEPASDATRRQPYLTANACPIQLVFNAHLLKLSMVRLV